MMHDLLHLLRLVGAQGLAHEFHSQLIELRGKAVMQLVWVQLLRHPPMLKPRLAVRLAVLNDKIKIRLQLRLLTILRRLKPNLT